MNDELLTLPQIANLSGYSYEAVRYRAKKGLIPCVKGADGVMRAPKSTIRLLSRREKYSRQSKND